MALATGAAAVCAFYAVLAIYAELTGWHYPFDGGPTFGFFPNRNHTATLLITGTMLSLGVLGVAYERKHWVAGGIATASIVACAGALVTFSESRGGVIFAILGAVIWLAGLGRSHRGGKLLYFLGFLVFACVFLLISGSTVRNRLWHSVKSEQPANSPGAAQGEAASEKRENDARLVIFADALSLLKDFPITGSGLGTFPLIFAQYEKVSLGEMTSIHPESDWLMFADEAGVPAVALAVALLWILCRRVMRFRQHPYWPLRWGCMVALLAALLHGLVDVPAHRVALGWWMLALAGLAFQAEPSAEKPRSLAQRAILLMAGCAACVLGTQLVRSEWFGSPAMAPFAERVANTEIDRLCNQQVYDAASDLANAAFKQSPLSVSLAYRAGSLLLCFDGTEKEADVAFDAQRRLSPNWPGTARSQAMAWAPVDPSRAAAMWTEALNRRERIDKAEQSGTARTAAFLGDAFYRTREYPKVQESLLQESLRNVDCAIAAAANANLPPAAAFIKQLASDEGFLARFSPPQKARFISVWRSRGDRDALAQFQAEHPDW